MVWSEGLRFRARYDQLVRDWTKARLVSQFKLLHGINLPIGR